MLYYVDQRVFFLPLLFRWHVFLFADADCHDFPVCSPLAFYSLSVYFGRSPFSLIPSDLASLELVCK